MVPCSRIALYTLLACGAAAWSAEPVRAASPANVTFVRKAPAKGDVASQSSASTLTMDVSVHLGQQVMHEETTRVDRLQERLIRLTHVEPGVRMAAEVVYRRAEEAVGDGDAAPAAVRQPVAGKTYRIERQGEELRITGADGQIPPQDEFEIVWHSMEAFGKPNALTEFLAGQTVSVGQTLEVPAAAAARLLAFGDDVVEVERFSLTLQEVQQLEQGPRAVFHALVSSRSHGRSQMGMQVEGTLAVDAATCRVALLELTGPVGMAEARPNGPDTYLISGRGKIQVAIRGEFQSR